MYRFMSAGLAAAVVWMVFATAAVGQERPKSGYTSDRYLISARAGGVNFVEGTASVIRGGGRSGTLLKGDMLQIGDQASTGDDSRLEVLMNPGSYMRLGPNSEFQFKTTSLDDLQVQVDKGSAVFEVFAANEFTVSIFTPLGKAVLVESGVYRVEIGADGSGIIAVTDGRALVGESETVVKKGRTGTIDLGAVKVAKFDRGKLDALGDWSKSRAKGLAKMTESLKNRDARSALQASRSGRLWSYRDSFGLWVLDPFTRSYCFLPFGRGWYSPYGYSYSHGLYWYDLPYVAPIRTPIRQPPLQSGDGDKIGRTPRRDVYEPPPFVKLERSREPSRIRNSDFPDVSMPVPSRSYDLSLPAPVLQPGPAPVPRGDKPR